MAISLSGSLELTGSLVVTGGVTMSGSIASASYASNAELLDGRDSLTFANTGSNSFVGSQNINGSVAITGSLTTTGAITAQTLNVQQVTSSIVYSSGSNIFGNSVSNTQSMTGSVGISGSLSVNGVSTLSGALSGTSATFSGDVTLHSGTGTSIINIGGTNGDYATQINLIGNNTFKNWQIGSNTGVQGSLEIRSSTTNGGTTFTTPVFSLASTGAATFSGYIFANGAESNTINPVTTGQISFAGGYSAIRSAVDHSFNIDVYNSASPINALKITQAGAATFSGSVTAQSLDVISSSGVGSSGASGLARFITAGTTTAVSIGQSNSARKLDIGSQSLKVTGDDFYIVNASSNATIFENNGAERLKITSGGNVGIGTTSPASKLDVTAPVESPALGTIALIARTYNGANDIFRWYDGTTQLGVFKNSGNVGIGVTTPGDKLIVNGNLGVTDGSFASGESYSLYIGDKNAFMNSTFGQKVKFGAYNGFDFGAAINGDLTLSSTWLTIASTGAATFSESVNIGNSAGVGKVQIWGVDQSSANYAQVNYDSQGNAGFLVRNDGLVAFPRINNFTTGNSPNTWINPASSYGIYINTSSCRYKKEISNYDKGIDIVNQLRPVYYKGISEVDGDKQFVGLIAEEIHDLGLTEFVNYNEEGLPNSLSYPNMIALAFKAIQEQQSQIEALKLLIK